MDQRLRHRSQECMVRKGVTGEGHVAWQDGRVRAMEACVKNVAWKLV